MNADQDLKIDWCVDSLFFSLPIRLSAKIRGK
jgi:hypothetical protein